MIAVDIGSAKARAWPVNSIIKTSDEISPRRRGEHRACAEGGGEEPDFPARMDPSQSPPNAEPISAPAASEGVNRPPGAPLAAEATVASGRRRKSAKSVKGASGCRKSAWARSCPLPRSSGNATERPPTTASTAGGAMKTPPAGRAVTIGPGDRPDERHRPQADERRGDDRPEVDIGRNGLAEGNRVERRIGHDEARRLDRDEGSWRRRHDEPESASAPRSTSSAKRAPPGGTL